MFFTLTFPKSRAPDEDEAQASFRRLVAALRHPSRDYLGAYGWVLQRQENGTLHFHGIAQLVWFADGLEEWRCLIERSGFGIQNKLVVAEAAHAAYCARYIATRLAPLERGRRAYSFSRDFPKAAYAVERERVDRLLDSEGIVAECDWVPGYLFRL